MHEKIEAFKQLVKVASSNPDFIHHEWFVEWHLQIVEKIALELLGKYPEADRDLVLVMVWLHDYGKIIDFDNQYERTMSDGIVALVTCGFDEEFAQRAVDNIAHMDRKMEVNLHDASIEIQIVASADGLSHMIGPFMSCWWKEQNHRSVTQLMEDNRRKIAKDWERKIVLPEARVAAQARRAYLLEMSGNIPDKIIS